MRGISKADKADQYPKVLKERDRLDFALNREPVQPSNPVVPKPFVPKHWYRCQDCLSVAVVSERLRNDVGTCGACSGKLEYLGRTTRSGLLGQYSEVPACDGRCTHATGPQCFCECGGENHGSQRWVEVLNSTTDKPTLAIDPSAQAKGEAWRAKKAEVWEVYNRIYGGVNAAKRAGEWIPNWSRYMEGQEIRKRILQVCAMGSYARAKKLEEILRKLSIGEF